MEEPANTPVRVRGVNELVLEVVELERSVRFYTGVLGLRLIERHDDAERAWPMAGTQTRIGLWRSQVGIANGRGGVHVHYAMHILESDFDEALTHLERAGAAPSVIEWDDGRGRSAYVGDPDGNIVELWTWDVSEYPDDVGGLAGEADR